MKEIEFKEVNEFKIYLKERNQENYLRIAMYTNKIYIGIFIAQVKNISVTEFEGFHIIINGYNQHFIVTCDKISVFEVLENE